MKLSDIRTELVSEHAALRKIAGEIHLEAQRIIDGESTSLDALRASLTRFDESLQAHNRHEESLLREEIRNIDAWGPQREALMDDSHEQEHADIVRSLGECGVPGDPKDIARRAQELVRHVLDHMKGEEREILHPDLLRDDIVSVMGASE